MRQKEHEFRVQEQVRFRRPILHGRGSQLIKIGTILAFADNGTKAVISCPADMTRVTVPLDQLEPISAAYGRARVQVNPVHRTIGSLMR
jgi:hypothetical protein